MVCVAFEVPPDDDATEDDAETEGDDDAEDAAMEAGHAGEGTCTECAAWSPDLEEEDSGTECAACWSPDPEESEDVACAGVSTSECDCNSHASEHACVRVCVHSSVRSVCVCVCARVCASVCSCEDEEADDGEGRVVTAEMLEDDGTSRD